MISPPALPQPQPPQTRKQRGGRHGLMMITCCIPMLAIAVVLVATGVVGVGFIFVAILCAAMMALMMRGMNHGGMDHEKSQEAGAHRGMDHNAGRPPGPPTHTVPSRPDDR